ncbi:MAG: sulfite exporter TauE/SafE family protein [Roseococcus sp.]|nr:sulfite exporter TauE/SafE family protein [Roseococcus sp.]
MLANCLHDLAALGPAGLPALMSALLLAGLAGGLTHCSAMCGPFVLAQSAAGADAHLRGGMLRRLTGAALLPYHLGRALGYGALGTLAGGAGALLSQASGLRWVAALLLFGAALLMLAQASARFSAWLPRLPAPRLPRALEGRLAGLLAAPTGWRGVRLGLLLSALPCGLLYAALAAAAASGSALAGGLAMLAFVLGTVPALAAVALLGRFFGRVVGPGWRALGGALFLLNAAILAGLAVQLLA